MNPKQLLIVVKGRPGETWQQLVDMYGPKFPAKWNLYAKNVTWYNSWKQFDALMTKSGWFKHTTISTFEEGSAEVAYEHFLQNVVSAIRLAKSKDDVHYHVVWVADGEDSFGDMMIMRNGNYQALSISDDLWVKGFTSQFFIANQSGEVYNRKTPTGLNYLTVTYEPYIRWRLPALTSSESRGAGANNET